MNNCSFIGRVGKDAVLRHTGSGKPILGFSVAVDTGYGDKKQTTWLDCAVWGERSAKLESMIRKGDRIGVQGELGTREHEGKTYITLRVSEVTLLAGKRGDAPKPEPEQQSFRDSGGSLDDAIPFRQHGTRRTWAVV